MSHTPDEIAYEIVAEFNTTAAFCSVSDALAKRISEMLDAYAYSQLSVAEMQERCATVCDDIRDDGLNIDLQTEPLLWVDGYEHGARDCAASIRALPRT